MPIFEYRCEECGHVTDFLEKAGRRRKHACEKCGSTKTAKLLSAFAPHAAGAGTPDCSRAERCSSGTCPFAKG